MNTGREYAFILFLPVVYSGFFFHEIAFFAFQNGYKRFWVKTFIFFRSWTCNRKHGLFDLYLKLKKLKNSMTQSNA